MRDATEAFSIANTYFFGRATNGKLRVYWHYTQGKHIITMYVAEAIEVRPGVWVRDNKMDGQSRFPKRYTSEHDALKGMVAKSRQDQLFLLDQSAVAARRNKAA